MDSSPACHVCDTSPLARVTAIEAFRPVSSDIRAVPGRLSLARCPRCGVLQKVLDARWRGEVQALYSDYAINHQSEGADPYIFKSIHGPGPRASILARHLGQALGLRARGRLLDIGCGNGNFLARFGEAFPEWSLSGLETSSRWRDTVLALPGVEGFHQDLDTLAGHRFDLIVMSHVLEHIPDPAHYLAGLRGLLADEGALFVAAPDIRQNPIDLVVLDHCSHFDEPTLARVLRLGGFRPESLRSDVLGKELVAVARALPSACAEPAPSLAGPGPFAMPLERVADLYLSLCADLVTRARELRAHPGRFGLFGTSTAACWLTGELDTPPDFYVEEDPQRVGRSAFGRPILAPGQVPSGACVFIPMSCETARAIIVRAGRTDYTLDYLPWNQIDEAGARL